MIHTKELPRSDPSDVPEIRAPERQPDLQAVNLDEKSPAGIHSEQGTRGLGLEFAGAALHWYSNGPAVSPGEGQLGNVGQGDRPC